MQYNGKMYSDKDDCLRPQSITHELLPDILGLGLGLGVQCCIWWVSAGVNPVSCILMVDSIPKIKMGGGVDFNPFITNF